MRRNFAAVFYAVVLMGGADTVRAAGETNATSFCSPLMPAPPKIDGTINPAEWLGAQKFEGFTCAGGMNSGKIDQRRATGWIGADE
ncbi:MAG: hypothetical protein WCP55_03795, partial [Lentisphaerota bacterium]